MLLEHLDGNGFSYSVKNIATGLCLATAGGSSGLNVSIVQYTCDEDQTRLWTIAYAGGSYGLKNNQSQLCLSPAGGSAADRTPIVQYTCDSDLSRAWTEYKAYQIANENPGGRCLTVAGGGTVRNTTSVQYYCDREPSRIWRMSYFGAPQNGNYYLQNVNSDLCLSPAGGAVTPNTVVVAVLLRRQSGAGVAPGHQQRRPVQDPERAERAVPIPGRPGAPG